MNCVPFSEVPKFAMQPRVNVLGSRRYLLNERATGTDEKYVPRSDPIPNFQAAT